MTRRYQLSIFLSSPESSLTHQVGDFSIGCQYLVAVSGLAGTIFNQSFNPALIEMGENFLIAKTSYPLGISDLMFLIALHHWIEIGANLKNFVKLVVPVV